MNDIPTAVWHQYGNDGPSQNIRYLTKGQDDEDHNPKSRIDVNPVVKQDTYCSDLGRDRQKVAIDKIVPNSKAQSRIN